MKERKDNGQFMPGRSGNPKGRPTTESAIIRKQLAINYEDIINTIRSAALGGDMQACKLILERICPPLKPQAAPIVIKLPRDGDLTQIAKAFVKASAEGHISPEVAAQMISAIGQLARITEINEKIKPEEEEEPLSLIRIRVIGEDGIERDLNPRHREED